MFVGGIIRCHFSTWVVSSSFGGSDQARKVLDPLLVDDFVIIFSVFGHRQPRTISAQFFGKAWLIEVAQPEQDLSK